MSFQLYLSLASGLFCCSIFSSPRTVLFIALSSKQFCRRTKNLTLLLSVESCLIYIQYLESLLSLASHLYLQLDSDYELKVFSLGFRNSFMSLLCRSARYYFSFLASQQSQASNMSVLMANICVNMSALRSISFLLNQLFQLVE